MPSYNFLVERVYEMSQIIVSLSAAGIGLCIALFVLWNRYEELMRYIKDDGLSQKFREYQLGQVRVKRIRRGECPTHGTPLKMYGGKCPIKGCKEEKA